MKTIAISEFKARCIAELKGLAQRGEPIEITLRGHRIARVEPIVSGRRLGTLAGSMNFSDQILESELEASFDDRELERLLEP
jgi:antitoxin (DNA-binding transcriptional repressor) of toxin-antitoxin stability system